MDLLGQHNSHRRRQRRWFKLASADSQNSFKMDASGLRISPAAFAVSIIYLYLLVCTCPVSSSISPDSGVPTANQSLNAGEELKKLRRIRAHLKKFNRPSVRTIQAIPNKLLLSIFRFSCFFPGFRHAGTIPACWCNPIRGNEAPINRNRRPVCHGTKDACTGFTM